MRQLTALFLAATALVAGAQTTQKFTASKLNEYGLVYNLPLTVVDVTVEAEKTVSTPGEFYKYCGKYLGAKPVTEPSTEWSVKSIVITTRGIADEKESYLVQFKNGSAPFMLLDENSFPSSAIRAELAAARIYELRQSRSDIVSGNADQAPTDGEGLKLVLANLQQQEDALTAMFTGTKQVSTAVRTYSYVPDGNDDETALIVGRLSQTDDTCCD